MRNNKEQKLSHMIASYLTLQYPDVVYRFDIAADIKLTIGQANIVKNKLKHKRGFQDLTILEPNEKYNGLLIELKKDISEVYTKKGELKKRFNKKTGKCHNREQFDHLEKMRKKGYKAEYGFGFDATKNIIDNYLKIKQTKLL